MKIYITLFLILICNICFSQDSRLFEQDWYLHDLIVDGQSNVPPRNSELPYVLLQITEPNEFITRVCVGTGGGALLTFNGDTEFSIQGGINWLAGSCNIYENVMFTDLYEFEFWDESSLNPIQYEIIENGQNRMLTITSSNGDKAIYGDSLLSLSNFDIEDIRIYPNPVNEILNLEHLRDVIIKRIIIFDLHGKELLLEEKNFFQIDVSNLNTGMYFISIESNIGKKLLNKFMKR